MATIEESTNETPFNEQPLYKQGYKDAAEYILSQLQDKYETQSKQDGYKVTCMASRRHTPQERYERHQGFLSGLLVAIGLAQKAMEE